MADGSLLGAAMADGVEKASTRPAATGAAYFVLPPEPANSSAPALWQLVPRNSDLSFVFCPQAVLQRRQRCQRYSFVFTF